MYRMIKYEPEKRVTAAAALEHPWLAAFYDPDEDEFTPQPVEFSRWKDLEALQTLDEFREAIWDEIQVCFWVVLVLDGCLFLDRIIVHRLVHSQMSIPHLQWFLFVNQCHL
jgi:hypothetical protein